MWVVLSQTITTIQNIVHRKQVKILQILRINIEKTTVPWVIPISKSLCITYY